MRTTAFPSKMPEYLASGRPILVQAPPKSYLVRYAKQHGFAEIVDEPDVSAAACAVRRLATDSERRAELLRNAAVTLQRHDALRVVERLRAGVTHALEGN